MSMVPFLAQLPSQRLSPEEAEVLDKHSVEFTEQERASFIDHMTAGLTKLHTPIEESISDKLSEVIKNQALLTELITGEVKKHRYSDSDIRHINSVLHQIPSYRNKLIVLKKEMVSLNKRCSKLTQKSNQLSQIRDKIRHKARLEVEKMEQLEARVVTTTPNIRTKVTVPKDSS